MSEGTGGNAGPAARTTAPAAPGASPPPARRGRAVLLRLAGTALILGFILSQLDVGDVLHAMRRVGPSLWLTVLTAIALIHLLAAFKWQRLLVGCGLTVARRDAVRAHFAGLFANTVLPSIIGGDAVRLGYVVRDGSRLTAAATAGAADRATDVVALIVLAAAGSAQVPLEEVARRILLFATGALLVGGAVGLAAIRILDADRFGPRPAKAIRGLQLALDDLAQRKRAVVQALIAAVFVQGCLAAMNVVLGGAVGIAVPAAAWFVVWPLAKLVALTPVSLGGLGVREGAVVALMLPFGVDPDLAMAEALLWYTQMLGIGLVGGALSAWLGRRDPRRRAV